MDGCRPLTLHLCRAPKTEDREFNSVEHFREIFPRVLPCAFQSPHGSLIFLKCYKEYGVQRPKTTKLLAPTVRTWASPLTFCKGWKVVTPQCWYKCQVKLKVKVLCRLQGTTQILLSFLSGIQGFCRLSPPPPLVIFVYNIPSTISSIPICSSHSFLDHGSACDALFLPLLSWLTPTQSLKRSSNSTTLMKSALPFIMSGTASLLLVTKEVGLRH